MWLTASGRSIALVSADGSRVIHYSTSYEKQTPIARQRHERQSMRLSGARSKKSPSARIVPRSPGVAEVLTAMHITAIWRGLRGHSFEPALGDNRTVSRV